MSTELFWLALTLAVTALLPFPYVLNRIAVRGLGGALANPSPTDEPLAPWAERARRAHANAVENLVLFAPAALAIHLTQRGDGFTVAACMLYLLARLTHYLAYTFGIPGLRTLAFFGGWVGIAMLVARLLGWV
ncbi:MAPEG family protein [Piscinibacter aquaticus]|uniref:MAPEG family protein n=1 Tax=Piscinibacter aquaticus TaxID=392597 RepID=A0A5C6U6X8_9BURK|nr:MAPEG family protein [Piscinibacter aquaticus]